MTETKLLHPGDLFPALSGAIGRLVPQDVVGLVRYLREHAPAKLARATH
jgi:hypothetical protein